MLMFQPPSIMVIEERPESHLIGIMDQHGRQITHTERKDPIGFVWLRERADAEVN